MDIDNDSAKNLQITKKGPERPALFVCSMELQCKEKEYVL